VLTQVSIHSLLEEDENDSPDESDSESDSDTPGTDWESVDSGSDVDSDSESITDAHSADDVEAGVDNLFVVEPIIEDGELDQSYINIADSSMADPMSQLELSLAELSMQDGEYLAPPGLEGEVPEPIGDYSFLEDSPAASDRTTTPPHPFFDDSTHNAGIADEPGNMSVAYTGRNQSADGSELVAGGDIELLTQLDRSNVSPDNSVNSNSDQGGTPDLHEATPRWGAPIDQCLPLLDRLHKEKLESGLTHAYPFADWMEFEFVKWMVERDISQGSRERLMKLPIVSLF
jgi:hypothetical protein